MSAWTLTALAFTILGLFWIFLMRTLNLIEKAARKWREDSPSDRERGA